MKRIAISLSFAVFSLLLLAGVAAAQSSGNFTYGSSGQNLQCVLNSNGTITGGAECFRATCLANTDCSAISGSTGQTATCVGATSSTTGMCEIPCTTDSDCATGETCDTGTGYCNSATGCNGAFGAAIKTSSGNGNVFVVRPSAVIGLLTDVKVMKSSSIDIGTSSALAGVDFTVTANLLGGSGTSNVCVTPNFPVTYDSRFIQISTNLFDQLGATCTTTAGCYFSFSESTVSAHSFDWIIGSPAPGQSCSTLQSGTYGITASWNPSLGNSGLSQALTCVGPVNVTVEQNKVFHFNAIN